MHLVLIFSFAHYFRRQTDLRAGAEADLRGSEVRRRSRDMPGRGVSTAGEFPLGLQQYRGDGRRAAGALQELNQTHPERPHIPAGHGNGLRHRALLGEQHGWPAEECLHISHHSCRYVQTRIRVLRRGNTLGWVALSVSR